jgi:hypothetical protein
MSARDFFVVSGSRLSSSDFDLSAVTGSARSVLCSSKALAAVCLVYSGLFLNNTVIE